VNSPEDFLLLLTLSVIPAGGGDFFALAVSDAGDAETTGGLTLATSFADFFEEAQPASMVPATTTATNKGFFTIIQSI
jgi:hypothetical protein